jgi:hypothetical protein
MSPDAANLGEVGTGRIADAPIDVANSLRDLDGADAVPHRHDHVGRAQDLVGGRPHERLLGVDAELLDRRPDRGVDRPLRGGADRMHDDTAARQQRRQPSRELATAAAAEAHEDDVEPGALRAHTGSLERDQPLAREPVCEDRQELVDDRRGAEPLNRVLDELLDLRPGEALAVLADELVDHRADLVAGVLIELHYESSSSSSSGSTGRSSSGSLVGSQSSSSPGVMCRNLRRRQA